MAGCTAPIRSCLCALMTPMLATVSQGAQVSIPYQGLRLNGELRLVPDGRLTDGVVLTLHGGLAHGRMSLMAYLQQLLVEAGHNSLSINLSLGVDDRRGMLPCDQTHRHRQDDAIEELAAWSRWLKAQGARSIVLLGHSRGGAQVARYAALAMSPVPTALILLAPATAGNTDAQSYQARYQQPLEPRRTRARLLAGSGRGKVLLSAVGLLSCRSVTVTADSFLS